MQYQLLCVLFSFSQVGVRHDRRSNFMDASMGGGKAGNH